jgi:uncharacterized protein
MWQDLLAALCLVLVLEGLLLLAAPDGWKRIAAQMLEMPSRHLRNYGAVMVVLGLVSLQLVR